MPNVPSTIPATRRRVTLWMFGILVPLGIALLGAMIWLWPSGNYQELSLDDPLWHHRQFHGGIRLGLIGAQYTL